MKLFRMLDNIELRNIESEMVNCDATTNNLIALTVAVCAIMSFINLVLIGYNSILFTNLLHKYFLFPDVPAILACVCGYFVYNSIANCKAFSFKSKTLSDIFVQTATTFSCMGIFSIALAIVK